MQRARRAKNLREKCTKYTRKTSYQVSGTSSQGIDGAAYPIGW